MLKLLIVEDEKKIRELLKIYFLRENYKVSEAENGRIALEMMKEETFDIVLLDIYMPELDGFDTCREIRKTSKCKTYSAVEKAFLLEKYKTSGAKKHNGAQKMSLA